MQYLRQGNIIDMAETQVLSNASLPITPNSSADLVSLDAVGQKQSVSGNFSAHLNGSIKELSNVDSGEGLPIDGKTLPQIISTPGLNDPDSNILSFTQAFQLNSSNANVLAETQVGAQLEAQQEIQPEILPESIDDKLLDIQSQLDRAIEEDVILPENTKLSSMSFL